MISLKNICYTYKNGTKALNDISLNIKPGEITMIIGKNGSGKSTLGNVIANIYKTKKGIITIDNININKIKDLDIRKKIGIVFQNPNNQIIFNRVYDDIAFTLNNLNINLSDNKIIDSLKEVDMDKYIYHNPYELSLGQKQRVAIAGVLSINPKYLVLDEPTSMLDSEGKKDIYKIINNLKKKDIGIIYITNNIEEILLADKLIILDEGKIIKELNKNEIINNIDLLIKNDIEIPFIIKVILSLKNKNIKNYTEEEILQIIEREI